MWLSPEEEVALFHHLNAAGDQPTPVLLNTPVFSVWDRLATRRQDRRDMMLANLERLGLRRRSLTVYDTNGVLAAQLEFGDILDETTGANE